MSGTTVRVGGLEIVSGGGTAVSQTISGSETLLSGGSISGTTIASGGTLVLSGGRATTTTVNAGGILVVASGSAHPNDNVVSGVRLVSGGAIQLANVSWVSGETATLSGGVLTVKNGGTTVATISGFTEATSGALTVTSASTGHGILITQGAVTSTISAHVKVADVRPTGATLVPLVAVTPAVVASAPTLTMLVAKGGAVIRQSLTPQTAAPTGFLQGMQLSVAGSRVLQPMLVAHANVGYSLDSVSARATMTVVGGSQINQHLAVLGTALSQRGAGER